MPATAELMPAPEPQALAKADSNIVAMFERLARDPEVDVAKLERLIAMQERIIAHDAKSAFDSAFAQMQGEIPVITKRGEIEVNGQVRSTFAKHEDIQRVIRPILQRHGFALRHRNEYLTDGKLKIIGILSHRAGHSECDEFVGPADTSGSKNAIQALGSTRSYGMRYTTIALVNITTEDQDDDGHGAELAGKPDVAAPDGFVAWYAVLEGLADGGIAGLTQAWNQSKKEYTKHLIATNRQAWESLKAKALKVRS